MGQPNFSTQSDLISTAMMRPWRVLSLCCLIAVSVHSSIIMNSPDLGERYLFFGVNVLTVKLR